MLTITKQTWLLLILVVLDLAIKMLVLHTLPPGQPIQECLVCLVLRLNSVSLGSHAQQFVANFGTQPLITGAVFGLALAVVVLVFASTSRLTKRSTALSIVVAFACAFGLEALSPSLGGLPVTTAAAATRVTQTILWLTIWALATSPLWKAGALLYAAAGLGNSLSLVFPPFLVVDYLWSSLLNRFTGMGVFNFADVLWLIGSMILATAFVTSVIRRLALVWMKLGVR
jgi:lipoprotein signal peptidase